MKVDICEIRIKLDQMTESIISLVKDRSRYKLNKKVYIKNAIPIKNKKDISFFEFALEGLEKYHASLGRYLFPDQEPLILKFVFQPSVKRIVPESPILKVKIDLAKRIINFYLKFLEKLCFRGDDPLSYGETVWCDAKIVQTLGERINLGKYVAEAKLKENPDLGKIKNRNELEKELRILEREREVLKRAKKIAKKYKLDPKLIEELFKWLMKETLKVEVEYIKKCSTKFQKK